MSNDIQTYGARIGSFAILDMETSNIPAYNFNKVSILELTIYGFSVDSIKKYTELDKGSSIVPDLPRVLHKLTLLFNPMRQIDIKAEEVTGLNNYILEKESKFNENAGHTMIGFLKHLVQPVCFVAHNGKEFDFPILKNTLNKLNLTLDDNILCVDSLAAFRDIDVISKPILSSTELESPGVIPVKDLTVEKDLVKENQNINWSAINETTPKRLPAIIENCPKRIKLNDSNNEKVMNARRCLFADEAAIKSRPSISSKYPPQGMYKLGNIYKRIFNEDPGQTHHAECDVIILTKLILHYGIDFLLYSKQFAIPFNEIKALGT